jgi:anti-anti-sigma factor
MIPSGVEIRLELQVRSDVLAFGFAGEHVADQTAVHLLQGDLRDHILETTERAPTGLVVMDMRNVDSLSATGMGRLLALSQRLDQVHWRLVLLICDPIVRAVFTSTHLDQQVLMAANEDELHALIDRYLPGAGQLPAAEEPPKFSESELAAIEADDITLDDAISAIERLRR